MPTEAFGTSQIKEIRFTRAEVEDLILENIKSRMGTPYDLDYARPWIVVDVENGDLCFRFAQSKYTREGNAKRAEMKPISESR